MKMYKSIVLGLAAALRLSGAEEQQPMNGGTIHSYRIANSESFDTSYKNVEFFEVYSKPIKTLYSEVHWRNHGDIKLPDEIIQRFAGGKVMAVQGYEVDQVLTSTGTPVPITWAYNHHFGAFLINSRTARLVKKPSSSESIRMGLAHGAATHWTPELFYPPGGNSTKDVTFPQVQFFAEGNGGEMRMSYHGYPTGYAQLIQSPDTFQVTPMQIDTWNREMSNSTFLPGPLPASSRIPPSAGYNGLIECPCSDAIVKEYHMGYAIDDTKDSTCTAPISNATECFGAARKLIPSSQKYNETITSAQVASPCSAVLHQDGSVDVMFNTRHRNGHRETQQHTETPATLVGTALGLVNLTLSLNSTANATTIMMTGPVDTWWGVGFGSTSMCMHMQSDECPSGGPYAIIVSGTNVMERKLGYHGPGKLLETSLQIVENTVRDGKRSVTLQRKLAGMSPDHFSFDPTMTSLSIIQATGCDLQFAQHCGHGTSKLSLLPIETVAPLCRSGIKATIGGQEFERGRCAGFPFGLLADQKNPTCKVESYRGGLSCCRDGKLLLDRAQENPWPDHYLEYRLKFRFYFADYKPTSPVPSHTNLARLYWQTEAFAGEYDVVQCKPRTPPSQCIHAITSRWTVRDMMHDCSVDNAAFCTGTGSRDENITEGIKLIYAAPHCHAPSCLSMELYNADTGRLLCRVEPVYGQSHEVYDEKGFLSLPPCLWGDAGEGLSEPELLQLHTTLLSIKRNNSTLPHTGEMASWQMRGIVVPKRTKEESGHVLSLQEIALRRTEGD